MILLKTKLHIPPVRSELVTRPRLFEQLDLGLERKFTLISAPAGFGKTTLVSVWLKERGIATAWLSLDKDDNDPDRFWFYFITALQTIAPGIGEGLLAILLSSSSHSYDFILRGLTNEIADIPSHFVFVLDDFHYIDDKQIQEGVQFLVNHLPLNMHLILSSRADPPWPFASLRARGELLELRVNELRFTLAESTAFLNTILGFDLNPEDVSALDARTEGWIAGLQMSALSMQGKENKAEFISALSGVHRFILDYLVEEVLDQQSAEFQKFLLMTSILDRLTAPLCDEILQREDSQNILEMLEKSNLFLHSLDDDRRWYRYHHLFADLLRSNLAQRYPNLIPELHRRACGWFIKIGLVTEAINHAFMSGDVEYVASIIEENTLSIITVYNERLPVLVEWLDALPKELLRSRPWLAVARAWALAYSGELSNAQDVLNDVEQFVIQAPVATEYKKTSMESLAGYLAVIQGYMLIMGGDITDGVAWMEKAILTLPKRDIPIQVFSAVVLGAAIGMQGNLERGIKVLTETYELCRGYKNPLLPIMVLCELAGLQILQGQLRQVIVTCEKAQQLSNEFARLMGLYPPNMGFAYARLSYVLREQNNLDAAIHYAQEAVKISKNWGQKDSLCISYLYLALALQAAGRVEDAKHFTNLSRQVAGELSRSIDATAAAYEARLYLSAGEIPFLSRWAKEKEASFQGELSFPRAREYIIYARALMNMGKSKESLELLSHLLPIAETAGAKLYGIEILILQGLVLQEQGNLDLAIVRLERALILANPEGYVRIFIDEGARMGELLRQAAQRGIFANYVHKLLKVLDASTQPDQDNIFTAPGLAPAPLGDTLTRREIEILRMLVTGRSIPEIADECCIAISTLRTHIRNIYDKLGVHSRVEAVAVSRELNLP